MDFHPEDTFALAVLGIVLFALAYWGLWTFFGKQGAKRRQEGAPIWQQLSEARKHGLACRVAGAITGFLLAPCIGPAVMRYSLKDGWLWHVSALVLVLAALVTLSWKFLKPLPR